MRHYCYISDDTYFLCLGLHMSDDRHQCASLCQKKKSPVKYTAEASVE